MNITQDIKYIGVNDREIDLFEGQYTVPNGMAYNSYVILDEKTVVMDTVDAGKTKEWLIYVEQALEGRMPDYLVVQHMEPDHSASMEAFREKYPQTTVVKFQNPYHDRAVLSEDEPSEYFDGKGRRST